MRPEPACRTFNAPAVEKAITSVAQDITDPDLKQLFVNTWPSTLDTTIKWYGYAANNSQEELTFIITGDINAMWLRDSANQLQSYLPVLKPVASQNSLAGLFRGAINLQARYLLTSPYCQSFQPPPESGLPPQVNSAISRDNVFPPYSNQTVFECKYELDSLASFLQLSYDYYSVTKDITFFRKFNWVNAVKAVMQVAQSMQISSTYYPNGSVQASPYRYTRLTTSSSGTMDNKGTGNPVQSGIGLIRSFFRPSDDAVIYQYFIPANMMFSTALARAAKIMQALGTQPDLASSMTAMASEIRTAISEHAIIPDKKYGEIYAFEVDGYGSTNTMDDSNVPSLLSAPFLGYLDPDDQIYQNTRRKILGTDNPYWQHGPVFSAVGGPHDGPGMAWPMASIMRIFTSNDSAEISRELKQIVSSTDGLGLIHESISTFNASVWTRQWFSWANGLFGQMILDLHARNPQVLKQSFQ